MVHESKHCLNTHVRLSTHVFKMFYSHYAELCTRLCTLYSWCQCVCTCTHTHTHLRLVHSRACARSHDHSNHSMHCICVCVLFRECLFPTTGARTNAHTHSLLQKSYTHRLFLSNGWCLRARTAHAAVHKPCASRPRPMCSLLGWPKPSIFRSIDPSTCTRNYCSTYRYSRPGYRYCYNICLYMFQCLLLLPNVSPSCVFLLPQRSSAFVRLLGFGFLAHSDWPNEKDFKKLKRERQSIWMIESGMSSIVWFIFTIYCRVLVLIILAEAPFVNTSASVAKLALHWLHSR